MSSPSEAIVAQITKILNQAWIAYDQNKPDNGRSLSESALALAQLHKLTLYQAQCFIALAEYDRQKGNYRDAHARIQHARIMYTDFASDVWFLRGVTIQAYAYQRIGDFSASLETWQEMLGIATDIDHQIGQAMALRRIGGLHILRGNFELGRNYHMRALSICEKIGFKTGIAYVYTNLASIYVRQGQIPDAFEYGIQAVTIHREMKSINGLAVSLGAMCVIYAHLGDEEKALAHAEEAKVYVVKGNWHFTWMYVYKRIAQMYQVLGNTPEALATLNFVMGLAEKAGDIFEQSSIHGVYSEIYEALDDFKQALFHRKQQLTYQQTLREISTQTKFETLEVTYQTQQAKREAQQQRQLREQDRLYFEKLSAIKDDIMSMASHDLKNPLANMGVVIYLLRKHLPDDDAKGREYLARIEHNIGQMRTLITNLLDLARMETGKSFDFERQDMRVLLREAHQDFELLAQENTIDFVLDIPEGDCIVRIDKQAMQQVLANLLSNAIKFTPAGGQVTLSAKRIDDSAYIEVTDTGVGLDEADIPHIFERFYRVTDNTQTQEIEGTGLGLSICKTIIEQHGGTICVDSKLGVGTTFYFTLPISEGIS